VPPGGPEGATWADDGTIFFSTHEGNIFKVPSAGGTPSIFAAADPGKGRYSLPHALPGGKGLIYTARSNSLEWDKARVVLQPVAGGVPQTLVEGGADARYSPSGHIIYMKVGTLMAVPFSIDRLQVTGSPVALIENVMQSLNVPNFNDETGAGQFAISNSGTLLYVTGGIYPDLEESLVLVDRKGNAEALPSLSPKPYLNPRFSPDGSKIAFGIPSGLLHSDLWIYDIHRAALGRVTSNGASMRPVWSPDGKRLIYLTILPGVPGLYLAAADGTGQPERLTTDFAAQPSSWAAQKNTVALGTPTSQGRLSQIWVLPMDGERKLQLFLESKYNLYHPEFSPDGRWIAYASNESSGFQVYVQPYPGPGEKTQVSTDGGTSPVWTANGREILYKNGQRFLSAAVTSLDPLRVETPKLLFEARENEYSEQTPIRGWDVSSDGQHFLLRHPEDIKDEPVTQIHVVLNWSRELQERVP
jgi:Tol biopolymer transport system component